MNKSRQDTVNAYVHTGSKAELLNAAADGAVADFQKSLRLHMRHNKYHRVVTNVTTDDSKEFIARMALCANLAAEHGHVEIIKEIFKSAVNKKILQEYCKSKKLALHLQLYFEDVDLTKLLNAGLNEQILVINNLAKKLNNKEIKFVNNKEHWVLEQLFLEVLKHYAKDDDFETVARLTEEFSSRKSVIQYLRTQNIKKFDTGLLFGGGTINPLYKVLQHYLGYDREQMIQRARKGDETLIEELKSSSGHADKITTEDEDDLYEYILDVVHIIDAANSADRKDLVKKIFDELIEPQVAYDIAIETNLRMQFTRLVESLVDSGQVDVKPSDAKFISEQSAKKTNLLVPAVKGMIVKILAKVGLSLPEGSFSYENCSMERFSELVEKIVDKKKVTPADYEAENDPEKTMSKEGRKND